MFTLQNLCMLLNVPAGPKTPDGELQIEFPSKYKLPDGEEVRRQCGLTSFQQKRGHK